MCHWPERFPMLYTVTPDLAGSVGQTLGLAALPSAPVVVAWCLYCVLSTPDVWRCTLVVCVCYPPARRVYHVYLCSNSVHIISVSTFTYLNVWICAYDNFHERKVLYIYWFTCTNSGGGEAWRRGSVQAQCVLAASGRPCSLCVWVCVFPSSSSFDNQDCGGSGGVFTTQHQ